MKKVYKIFIIICIFLNVFSLFACKKVNDENVFIEAKNDESIKIEKTIELDTENTLVESEEAVNMEDVLGESYEIVRINEEKELLSDVYILKNQSEGQILSIVIITNNGNAIVIDGGRAEDADYLYKFLEEKAGGGVGCWLLTHCHDDHVGALYTILDKYKDDIYINDIYYKFPKFEWLYNLIGVDAGAITLVENRIKEYSDFIKEKMKDEITEKPFGVIHNDFKVNDVCGCDWVYIKIMNDLYLIDDDPINNSTITYQVNMYRTLSEKEEELPEYEDEFTKIHTMLVLGDLSYEGGERLLQERGKDLKSDICVVAHHGQGGVWKDVYEAIKPDICIWPTTKKIYENKEGKYRTDEVKEWFEEIGVKKHYTTVDNGIILR